MWSRSLASPRAAAKWAGHSNPTLILSVYGGVFEDESNAVMERLTDYASPAGAYKIDLVRMRPTGQGLGWQP